MYKGNETIKWTGRLALSALNRFLCRWIGIKKLKTWMARHYLHRELDLEHPRKLNEKILYLAYETDTTLWSRLADKWEVRSYVMEKGLGEILIPAYGVYDRYEQIDFQALPERYVLKATHGCDMNYLCTDGSHVDHARLKRRVKFWLGHNMAYMSLEPHYARIPPRVLCEQLLETEGEIVDYKFFCCDGTARFVEVCSQRSKGLYLDLMTLDWEPIPAIIGAKQSPQPLTRPGCFGEMIRIANTLAEGLSFVRVDLYEVNGRVYFGEMTFTPATGVLFHFTEGFLLEQGKYVTLPSD